MGLPNNRSPENDGRCFIVFASEGQEDLLDKIKRVFDFPSHGASPGLSLQRQRFFLRRPDCEGPESWAFK